MVLSRSLMTAFTGNATPGTPDDEISTIVDVADHVGLRWRAIRAHSSQAPPYDTMTSQLQRRFLTTDHLLRVEPPWTVDDREHDWRPGQ